MAAKDDLLKKLTELGQQFTARLPDFNSLEAVEAARLEYLGKKGALTEILKGVGALSAAEKPEVGSIANELRGQIQSAIDEKLKVLKGAEMAAQFANQKIDVTLPGRAPQLMQVHPVQMVQDELVGILERCGFLPELGPEIEHEFFNFDALNVLPNHPSRSLQDTFYIKDRAEKILLRCHTSPVQIRTMLTLRPPIRMCCPGRVYRRDYDATHSPMFHQVEGLLVDEHIHMGDLKGILGTLVSEFFGAELKVRLRPSFFPFTEPSAEVDIQCVFCMGKGCKTCKGSGWIEIGGSGMVDPEVFKAVGIDFEKYHGFAFGMGIERMAMLKYGIDDLRAFYESDCRFVSQFARWRQ